MSGTTLRAQRRALQLTQRALAAALDVTPNTIARWERGEVPMPSWVLTLLQARQDVAALKATVRRLELHNLALEVKLRKRRERTTVSGPATSRVEASSVYKELVRKYHPDRNAAHAAVMADINALWQAVTRNPPARRSSRQ